MPRKPKREKQTITVIVHGKPLTVILHPPIGSRSSWFAYWPGLVASKSTGQRNLEDAILVAQQLVMNGRKRANRQETALSDEEFEDLQRAHFARKQDPAAQARAAKTLDDCLEAIDAFRRISGVTPIAYASSDDCASFQRQALMLPRNWRKKYPKSTEAVVCVKANTVLKWSRALQAAFERANRDAGKKCVRGVVPENKLLTGNPWKGFTWIEGAKRPIRQFDGEELLSFLNYLAARWQGVEIASALAKVFLWSSGRRMEVTSLTWASLRQVGNEHHFEIVGKWGIEKWFRVPEELYKELLRLKTDKPYVFAAYNDQLREFHDRRGRLGWANSVGTEFNPVNLGDWFHNRVSDWSKDLPKGRASTHIFRKTSLQHARTGEDVNRQVANDARVSAGVLMTHYVKETDEEMRQKSNRTFQRILASLPPEVARRFGHVEANQSPSRERIKAAYAAEDWPLVARLSSELAKGKRSVG